MKTSLAFFIRCLSLLTGVTALAMLVPLTLAIIFKETEMIPAFALPSGFVLCAVLLAIIVTRKSGTWIEASKGLFLVCLTWLLSCLFGAFPFYIYSLSESGSNVQFISFADAFFESASGFTTTGASIFTNVEALPRSLLFWRSMTQWLGGMGMVVLLVALIPLIGTGGFQLFRAEAPGPDKGRITPRITATAKILWVIYFAITLLQVFLLIAGGLNWFDAAVLSFSTMSTGGFSIKNSSVAAYNSPWAEWVCIVFIFIAGFNFNLIFRVLQGKGKEILKNSEGRAYGGIFLAAGIICACLIFPNFRGDGGSVFSAVEKSVRTALFQCVSILTTTGFSVDDHRLWHPLAQGVIFLLMFIGGCSSSTAGGIKVIRHVILFKQSKNELRKQLNPSGVFSIQLNGKEGQKNVVHGVAGFIFLYFVLVVIAAMVVSLSGMDLFSSINIGLLMTGNIGRGIVSGSMESALFNLPAVSKWTLSLVMIAGRLELWTIFAILFWGKTKLTGGRA